VLADLALESEAALALTMRIALALDRRVDEHEDCLARLCTAIGKYWICKRVASHAVEAMECIGGSGVMEDSRCRAFAANRRSTRIWEGSGNVQCLDALRAIRKTPAVVQAYFDEVARSRGGHASLDRHIGELRGETARWRGHRISGARSWSTRMAAILQARCWCSTRQAGWPTRSSRSRLDGVGHHQFGAPAERASSFGRIIERAIPRDA